MASPSKVHSVQSCSIACAARSGTGAAIAGCCSCYRQLQFIVALRMQSPVVNICTASGHYMYRTVVTICTASGHYIYRQWSLYIPPVVTICTASLTFSNSTLCPHSVFMCFVWIWEQTAIISLYNIKWLVCTITGTECVYCAVKVKVNISH